jgi:hypothetical protein
MFAANGVDKRGIERRRELELLGQKSKLHNRESRRVAFNEFDVFSSKHTSTHLEFSDARAVHK